MPDTTRGEAAALSEEERVAMLNAAYAIITEQEGDRTLYAAVERILAARIEAAKEEGANPILADALTYYAERRSMENPKGWAHVSRQIEQGIDADLWPNATEAHVSDARAILGALASEEVRRDGR